MIQPNLEYICLYQTIQKKYFKDSTIRSGNCSECIADEKNKLCKGYYPVKFYTLVHEALKLQEQLVVKDEAINGKS